MVSQNSWISVDAVLTRDGSMRLTRDSPVSGTSCPRSMILYMYGGSSLRLDGYGSPGSGRRLSYTGKDWGVGGAWFILVKWNECRGMRFMSNTVGNK